MPLLKRHGRSADIDDAAALLTDDLTVELDAAPQQAAAGQLRVPAERRRNVTKSDGCRSTSTGATDWWDLRVHVGLASPSTPPTCRILLPIHDPIRPGDVLISGSASTGWPGTGGGRGVDP